MPVLFSMGCTLSVGVKHNWQLTFVVPSCSRCQATAGTEQIRPQCSCIWLQAAHYAGVSGWGTVGGYV